MGAENALLIATVATCATFFAIGAMKSKWSTARWWMSGLETFAIGMVAAAVAYGVGALLKGLVGT